MTRTAHDIFRTEQSVRAECGCTVGEQFSTPVDWGRFHVDDRLTYLGRSLLPVAVLTTSYSPFSQLQWLGNIGNMFKISRLRRSTGQRRPRTIGRPPCIVDLSPLRALESPGEYIVVPLRSIRSQRCEGDGRRRPRKARRWLPSVLEAEEHHLKCSYASSS